jgi:gas vesicle protein
MPGLSRKARKNKQTHKSHRATQGGAYIGVMRPEDTKPLNDLAIQYICSHGEISPEIFYVIPPNVYILMPNVCGVSTSVTQTIADPIYQTKEEADRIFVQKFITGEMSGGTRFTVFCPGDIIPMQTFIFSPLVGSRGASSINLGFVGVFDGGALVRNPLFSLIKDKRVSDNFFSLNTNESLKFMFELLNNYREYFRRLKESGVKPSGNLWGLYRAVTAKLYGASITTDDLLTFNSQILYSNPNISRLPEYYRKTAGIYKDKIGKIGQNNINYVLSYLLPLIPENQLAEYLSEKYLENIKIENTIIPNVSLKTVVKLTKSEFKTTIFVVNACRSLLERSLESFESDGATNGVAAASAAAIPGSAAACGRYNAPNVGKPSSELIMTIDELNRNVDGDRRTAFNMKNINEIRQAVGLEQILQDVLTYRDLHRILSETIEAVAASATPALSSYSVLIDRIRIIQDKLGKYKPIEEIRATRFIKGNVSAATAEAVAALEEASVKEKETRRTELDREIESGKRLIQKLKLDVKYNKSREVKSRLATTQERLKELKKKLEELVGE